MNKSCAISAGLILCTALAAGGPVLSAEPDVAQILTRFDEVQESFRTLSAEFVETTTNRLLKDPIVSDGHFYMTKPDSIRWEYSSPEVMSFVIADDQYTGFFPSRKRAEQRKIGRWREKLFRFIGLGQASTELAKFYDIELDVDGGNADCHLLVLSPKKRRARKRVENVQFWIDRKSYLPIRVEYRGRNGNERAIEFREIQLNTDLAASIYTVEIPSDFQVTTGFSGLPGIGEE